MRSLEAHRIDYELPLIDDDLDLASPTWKSSLSLADFDQDIPDLRLDDEPEHPLRRSGSANADWGHFDDL
jgi:hypothetical protein